VIVDRSNVFAGLLVEGKKVGTGVEFACCCIIFCGGDSGEARGYVESQIAMARG